MSEQRSTGRVAAVVGVVVAVTSVIANMLIIDIHPVWSILVIAADVLIIYALTVHGDELKELE